MKARQLQNYSPNGKAKVSVAEWEAEVMAKVEVEAEVEAELFYRYFAIPFFDSQTRHAPRAHKNDQILTKQ